MAHAKKRIGPRMAEALEVATDHPGITMQDLAEAVGPHGSRRYGYRIVHRAIAAGLLQIVERPEKRGCYRVYPHATPPEEAKAEEGLGRACSDCPADERVLATHTVEIGNETFHKCEDHARETSITYGIGMTAMTCECDGVEDVDGFCVRCGCPKDIVMAKRWRIRNAESGRFLGVYAGMTAQDALDAMARDAGYADHAEAIKVAGDADLVVTEVE